MIGKEQQPNYLQVYKKSIIAVYNKKKISRFNPKCFTEIEIQSTPARNKKVRKYELFFRNSFSLYSRKRRIENSNI